MVLVSGVVSISWCCGSMGPAVSQTEPSKRTCAQLLTNLLKKPIGADCDLLLVGPEEERAEYQ